MNHLIRALHQSIVTNHENNRMKKKILINIPRSKPQNESTKLNSEARKANDDDVTMTYQID